ncbi:MAG: hypothetical protein ACOX5A_02735 [Aminivibrio sp.]|jgi:hypothetical protein|nr:cytotoxic translational repressor of toxin-antitoxin stability system [Synergistaceae bacterium]
MGWDVVFKRNVVKNLPNLPQRVLQALAALAADIETKGPVRGDWPNYSKLPGGRHHCHLKKGRPTYVAVWKDEKEKVIVEVIYVGVHENAPY